MPKVLKKVIFPWTRVSCACGRYLAVILRGDIGTIVDNKARPHNRHEDVEPCSHCHCLMLKPGTLTIAERQQ